MGKVRLSTNFNNHRMTDFKDYIGNQAHIEIHSDALLSNAGSSGNASTLIATILLSPSVGTVDTTASALNFDMSNAVGTATAAGTATYASLHHYASANYPSVSIMDMTIGLPGSGEPITMTNLSFAIGDQVTLTSLVITMGNLD